MLPGSSRPTQGMYASDGYISIKTLNDVIDVYDTTSAPRCPRTTRRPTSSQAYHQEREDRAST